MKKKILFSLVAIAAAAAVIIGGTTAFFSDTETSTGNTFTAGAVDIAITSIAHTPSDLNNLVDFTTNLNGLSFSFADLKPLDKGTVTYTLNNNVNEAYVCARVIETGNNDNGINDPEATANDTTDGSGFGELGQFLNFNFGTQSGSLSAISGVWQTVGTIASPGTLPAAIDYCFGEFLGNNCVLGDGVYNLAQTDSLTADVEFYAVQTRNNPSFTCGSLNPQLPKVGAKLSAYPTPSCTVTVSGASSIQTAINGVSDGQTVCVDGTYDKTGDNTPITITTSNVTLAAMTQGTALDVPVSVNGDGITVTGFTGSIGAILGQQAAFYIVNGSDNFEVSYNVVNGLGVGAGVMTEYNATYASGLIANNVLDGATQGMYLNPFTGGTITVEYNDIRNNVAGIGGLNGAIVRYNEFTHTVAGSEAIGTDSTFDSNVATVNFNNFLNGTKINDYGATPIINAENNFFNLGGVNQTTAGQVDFTPEAGAAYAHN